MRNSLNWIELKENSQNDGREITGFTKLNLIGVNSKAEDQTNLANK